MHQRLNLIESYKALNSAKFKVLEEMAPHLTFEAPSTNGDRVVSFRPFQKEWKEIGKGKLRASKNKTQLSSYASEKFLPVAFLILFSAVIILCIIPCYFHFNEFLTAWKGLLKIDSYSKTSIRHMMPYSHIAL